MVSYQLPQAETAMNPLRARLAAALLVGGALPVAALAQKMPADSDNPQAVPGQVMSDVQPLPAEDRDSAGAVLLHGSRVPAQRNVATDSERRNDPATVDRDVTRVMGGPPAPVKDIKSTPQERQNDPAKPSAQ